MRKQGQYDTGRRAVLKSGVCLCLGAIGTVLSAAEPVPGAKPKPSPTPRVADNREAIMRVLDDAMMSKNMKSALARHGGSLTAAEKNALLAITPAELAHLKSARSKLKGGRN